MIRNVWSNAVIFCGHFPDGAEKFTKTDMVGETKGQWYLRQMLGSANFDNGPVLRFMSGNLCYQIEHHLYPDLPSNRLHEISVRVREVCDKYDLPYTTGSFLLQYGKAWRTIAKLSLPDKYLRDTADDAPETRSERMFSELEPGFAVMDPATGRRRGLKTAIATVRGWRRNKRAAKRAAGAADGPRPRGLAQYPLAGEVGSVRRGFGERRQQAPRRGNPARSGSGQGVQRALRVGGRAHMPAAAGAVLDRLGQIGERQQHVVGLDVGQPERPDAGRVDHPAAEAQRQRHRLGRRVPSLADARSPRRWPDQLPAQGDSPASTCPPRNGRAAP